MQIPEIIRKKRDGKSLSETEIQSFVTAITDGSASEGQVAAFAMAVFFQGMNADECVALTRAMTHSGEILDWGDTPLPGPRLDKHSTGGVGDNVSLMLAPLLAAAGAFVPMISGRGLGHTGGTLDKLDAIPGYDTAPDVTRFKRAVREAGAAIIGQTADLAPADRRLYAVRDVTATVESIPLITASILSKKLAAGLEGLVLDVKTGNGAFAADVPFAQELARSLVRVANGAGLATRALITDMNQPLASAAGNAVEVQNAVDFLTGHHRDPRLLQVVTALSAELLQLGGLAESPEAAETRVSDLLASDAPAEQFQKMVAALGGPSDFVEKAETYLPAATHVRPIFPAQPGFVTAIDTRAVGLVVVTLGGGRQRAEDRIDPAVGLTQLAPLGTQVGPDRPLAFVHAQAEAQITQAEAALRAAYAISDTPTAETPCILDRITQETSR